MRRSVLFLKVLVPNFIQERWASSCSFCKPPELLVPPSFPEVAKEAHKQLLVYVCYAEVKLRILVVDRENVGLP
ncbi:hypothetical protein ACMFMG_012183 [Clarireedia jacksonii]